MTYQLLFLCTGNYYRSRYAEILFNTLAADMGLNWTATSRGLALEVGVNNVGPMYAVAIDRLQQQGITTAAYGRWPIQVQECDLTHADLIIALDETEHRPYLTERFADWPDRVTYWGVHDLGFVPAQVALSKIDQEVRHLVQRLATSRD
ncbi:MAG: low molecular weight phosphatase family protein [Anaerolineae bacterium]|nr:low molecular weight phosphatase family protein [Anaerolineae bacterium]